MAGEPRQRRRPERRPHPGGRAAPRGLPARHAADVESAGRPRVAQQHGGTGREHAVVPRRSPLQRPPVVLRALPLQRRPGRHAGSHGDRALRWPNRARRTWCSTTSLCSARIWSTSSRSATTGRRPAPRVQQPGDYDPVGVSLSGTFTSSSIDARGNTGIARSGLLIRATSASTTTGSMFDPRRSRSTTPPPGPAGGTR